MPENVADPNVPAKSIVSVSFAALVVIFVPPAIVSASVAEFATFVIVFIPTLR